MDEIGRYYFTESKEVSIFGKQEEASRMKEGLKWRYERIMFFAAGRRGESWIG